MFAGNARGGVARRGLIEIVQALYECSDIFLPLKTVCGVILAIHNTLDVRVTACEMNSHIFIRVEGINE